MTPTQLGKLAELYAQHKGLKLSTVSLYAAKDGKFFASLKGGSSCTFRRLITLTGWFDECWPEDLEWPDDTARPSLSDERKAS